MNSEYLRRLILYQPFLCCIFIFYLQIYFNIACPPKGPIEYILSPGLFVFVRTFILLLIRVPKGDYGLVLPHSPSRPVRIPRPCDS